MSSIPIPAESIAVKIERLEAENERLRAALAFISIHGEENPQGCKRIAEKALSQAALQGIKTGEGRYLVRKSEPHEVPPRLMTGVCEGVYPNQIGQRTYNRTLPSQRYTEAAPSQPEDRTDPNAYWPFLDRSRT